MSEGYVLVIEDRTGPGARSAGKNFNHVKQAANETSRALNAFGKQAGGATSSMVGMAGAMLGPMGIVAGIGMAAAVLSQGTQKALAFGKAFAELSTLLPGANVDLEAYRRGIKSLSLEFGGGALENTKAMYQIISAGATDAAMATETLRQANIMAVGGVTDVAVAADGLTTIMNAWGKSQGEMAGVSDALFTAMRLGKTTIPELAGSISYVAAVAATAGVSLDEVLAAIVALTKGGIPTERAMRGLAQVLIQTIKPQGEAAETAKVLGIELGAAALKGKGLVGFIEDLRTKTGGSTTALSKLYSGAETLVPILGLTGKGFKDLGDSAEAMGNKAGAAADAVAKMQDTDFQKLKVAEAAWDSFTANLGNWFTTRVLGPLAEAGVGLSKLPAQLREVNDAVPGGRGMVTADVLRFGAAGMMTQMGMPNLGARLQARATEKLFSPTGRLWTPEARAAQEATRAQAEWGADYTPGPFQGSTGTSLEDEAARLVEQKLLAEEKAKADQEAAEAAKKVQAEIERAQNEEMARLEAYYDARQQAEDARIEREERYQSQVASSEESLATRQIELQDKRASMAIDTARRGGDEQGAIELEYQQRLKEIDRKFAADRKKLSEAGMAQLIPALELQSGKEKVLATDVRAAAVALDKQAMVTDIISGSIQVLGRVAPDLQNFATAAVAFAKGDYVAGAFSAINGVLDILGVAGDEHERYAQKILEEQRAIRAAVEDAESVVMGAGGGSSDELKELQYEAVKPLLDTYELLRTASTATGIEDFRTFLQYAGEIDLGHTSASMIQRLQQLALAAGYVDRTIVTAGGGALAMTAWQQFASQLAMTLGPLAQVQEGISLAFGEDSSLLEAAQSMFGVRDAFNDMNDTLDESARASKAVTAAEEMRIKSEFAAQTMQAQSWLGEQFKWAGGDVFAKKEALTVYEGMIDAIRDSMAQKLSTGGVDSNGTAAGKTIVAVSGSSTAEMVGTYDNAVVNSLIPAASIPFTDAFPLRRADTFDDLGWTTWADAVNNHLLSAPAIPFTDAFPLIGGEVSSPRWSDLVKLSYGGRPLEPLYILPNDLMRFPDMIEWNAALVGSLSEVPSLWTTLRPRVNLGSEPSVVPTTAMLTLPIRSEWFFVLADSTGALDDSWSYDVRPNMKIVDPAIVTTTAMLTLPVQTEWTRTITGSIDLIPGAWNASRDNLALRGITTPVVLGPGSMLVLPNMAGWTRSLTDSGDALRPAWTAVKANIGLGSEAVIFAPYSIARFPDMFDWLGVIADSTTGIETSWAPAREVIPTMLVPVGLAAGNLVTFPVQSDWATGLEGTRTALTNAWDGIRGTLVLSPTSINVPIGVIPDLTIQGGLVGISMKTAGDSAVLPDVYQAPIDAYFGSLSLGPYNVSASVQIAPLLLLNTPGALDFMFLFADMVDPLHEGLQLVLDNMAPLPIQVTSLVSAPDTAAFSVAMSGVAASVTSAHQGALEGLLRTSMAPLPLSPTAFITVPGREAFVSAMGGVPEMVRQGHSATLQDLMVQTYSPLPLSPAAFIAMPDTWSWLFFFADSIPGPFQTAMTTVVNNLPQTVVNLANLLSFDASGLMKLISSTVNQALNDRHL